MPAAVSTEDRLAAAHGARVGLAHIQNVPHSGELLQVLGAYARFDQDVAPQLAGDGEAGLFHGRLHVHVVVDDVRDEVRMGERLIHAAHHAESDVLRAALHEGREP